MAEPEGYQTIVEQLRADTYAYIAEDPRDGNTAFFARNMVAL